MKKLIKSSNMNRILSILMIAALLLSLFSGISISKSTTVLAEDVVADTADAGDAADADAGADTADTNSDATIDVVADYVVYVEITDGTGTKENPSNALIEAIEEATSDVSLVTKIILPEGYFAVPTVVSKSIIIEGAGSTRDDSDTDNDASTITTLYFSEPLAVMTDNVSLTISSVDIDADVSAKAFINGNGLIELGDASNTAVATGNKNISLTISDSYMFEVGIAGGDLDTTGKYMSSVVYIIAQESPTITIDNSYLMGRYTISVSSYTGSEGRGYSHNTTNATYVINDSYLLGWTIGNMRGENTTYTATNCILEGLNYYSGTSNSYATFVMTDGSIDSSYTFDNCVITATNTGDQAQKCFNFQYGATDNELILKDCTFEMETANGVNTGVVSAGNNVSGYPTTSGNDVIINGVTYEDISNNDGAGQLYVVVGGKLVVSGSVAVNEDTQDSYATLNAAVAAATSGDTITLVSDYDISDNSTSTMTIDETLTIDLAGYDFVGLDGFSTFTINSGASLTLTDSSADKTGSVTVTDEYLVSGISNSGALVIDCAFINDGKVASDSSATTTVTADGSIENNGWILTSNVTLTNNGEIINNGTINGSGVVYNYGALTNNNILTNSWYSFYNYGTLINAANGTFTNSGWAAIEDGSSFTNNGTLTNSGWITFYEGATLANTGEVNNTGGFEYDYLPTEEVFGSVAYYVSPYDGVDYYEFYATLADAIADASDGDTVILVDDVTVTESIDILYGQNITIDGAGHTITSGLTTTTSDVGVFNVDNDTTDNGYREITTVFKNINFVLSSQSPAISAGWYYHTVANLTVDSCTVTQADGSTVTWAIHCTSSGNLNIINNTFDGNFTKALCFYSYLNENEEPWVINIQDNTFTGPEDTNTAAVMTINLRNYKDSDDNDYTEIIAETIVNITGNTFENQKKVISLDSCGVTGNWTIKNNSFINCLYAFDLSTANAVNTGYSLAYNYFENADGTVGTVKVLDSNSAVDGEYNYENNDTLSELTFYPYYADAAMTTLVYQNADGEEESKTTSEALASVDLDSLVTEGDGGSVVIDEEILAEATTLVTAVGVDAIAEDEELLEVVSKIDEAFAAANEIEVSAKVDENYEADDAISEAAVSGLAISAHSVDSTVSSTYIEVVQSEAEAEGAISLSIKPYISTTEGEVQISNDELLTPVTITITLPEGFEGNYVDIEHISEDSSIGTVVYEKIPVVSGTVTFTVAHFSTFNFTGYTVSSSSSSGSVSLDSSIGKTSTSTDEEADVDTDVDADVDVEEPEATVTPDATPSPTVAPTTAPTEDAGESASLAWVWILVAVLAVCGIVGFVVYKKKK